MIFHSKNSKHAMPTDFLVLKGPLHEVECFASALCSISTIFGKDNVRTERRATYFRQEIVTLHYYVRWL